MLPMIIALLGATTLAAGAPAEEPAGVYQAPGKTAAELTSAAVSCIPQVASSLKHGSSSRAEVTDTDAALGMVRAKYQSFGWKSDIVFEAKDGRFRITYPSVMQRRSIDFFDAGRGRNVDDGPSHWETSRTDEALRYDAKFEGKFSDGIAACVTKGAAGAAW